MSAVKSALRTLMVIELLTEHADGLTFPQIAERLDLPKSSAYALMSTMLERGHVTFDDGDRCYRIGLRLWEAGRAYDQAFDLPSRALPFLEAARDALQETVQLAVLDGVENVYIAKVESEQRLALASRVGMRLPAYATGLGKVLLAGLSEDELTRCLARVDLVSFTSNTITDREELIAELRRTRTRGWATDNGEYTAGVRCIAVPVVNREGATVAALSVSVPEIRLERRTPEAIRDVLVAAADRLSASLGWVRPQDQVP